MDEDEKIKVGDRVEFLEDLYSPTCGNPVALQGGQGTIASRFTNGDYVIRLDPEKRDGRVLAAKKHEIRLVKWVEQEQEEKKNFVWVVLAGEKYSDWILGVFSTEEKAKATSEKYPDESELGNTIIQMEIDQDLSERKPE